MPELNKRSDNRPTIFYVDGRNLFNGLLKKNRLPWFDIRAFLLDKYPELTNVLEIKYFSSPGKDELQEPLEAYHRALKTLPTRPRLSVFLGKVTELDEPECEHEGKCWIKEQLAEWPRYKEKQTDVGMAVEALSDALRSDRPCHKIILITNDSDFAPLIRKIKTVRPKTDVVVYAPVAQRRDSNDSNWICYELKNCASHYSSLRNKDLEKYLLPLEVVDHRGQKIRCPEYFSNKIRKRIPDWGS